MRILIEKPQILLFISSAVTLYFGWHSEQKLTRYFSYTLAVFPLFAIFQIPLFRALSLIGLGMCLLVILALVIFEKLLTKPKWLMIIFFLSSSFGILSMTLHLPNNGWLEIVKLLTIPIYIFVLFFGEKQWNQLSLMTVPVAITISQLFHHFSLF